MTFAWDLLKDELARWRESGRVVHLWWRDDDANQPTAALTRLFSVSAANNTPLALAVVPQDAHVGLLAGPSCLVSVLQHGVTHRNAARACEKKTEFPLGQVASDALASLLSGQARLEQLYPGRTLRVLVPPWNRISCEGLTDVLSGAGYAGLSRFGSRAFSAHLGTMGKSLINVNTHVDVIDWKGGRRFAGSDAILAQALRHLQARRLGDADVAEATGLLTHHAIHDPAAWAFLERLFAFTTAQGAVWQPAQALFPSL